MEIFAEKRGVYEGGGLEGLRLWRVCVSGGSASSQTVRTRGGWRSARTRTLQGRDWTTPKIQLNLCPNCDMFDNHDFGISTT